MSSEHLCIWQRTSTCLVLFRSDKNYNQQMRDNGLRELLKSFTVLFLILLLKGWPILHCMCILKKPFPSLCIRSSHYCLGNSTSNHKLLNEKWRKYSPRVREKTVPYYSTCNSWQVEWVSQSKSAWYNDKRNSSVTDY